MSMKPPTVFLGEMTNPEVEAFLQHHQTVIVPIGSTEQHGPHAPLLTDVLIPVEVARRVAPRIGGLVAPPINYALSYPHAGFTGVVQLRIATFMAVIEDLCASLATVGFRRIVFLNGHYDNTYAIAYACANAAERMPADVRAFPINYWDGMTPAEAGEFFDPSTGLHANRGETSAVLAINPALVDMDRANVEMPPFPDVANGGPVHTAFFFSAPGSVHRATRSGTWGDPRQATAEFGNRYLEVVVESTIRMLDDIDRTFEAMPRR
jgi:creatinine amidohydrolase